MKRLVKCILWFHGKANDLLWPDNGPTTAQQRKLLFETWQASGNVAEACRRARVSRQTFYNWKPRFETEGYAGLEELKSHAPKHPRLTPAPICDQVILMRQENPKWGKRRIADELKKANDWVALVSPNTVRRILIEAGMWEPLVAEKKAHPHGAHGRGPRSNGQC